MTSYYDDEPPHPSQGRSRVPGAGGYEPADEFDPFAPPPQQDPYAAADPYAPPSTRGRASVRPPDGFDANYGGPGGGGYGPPAPYEPTPYGAPGGGGLDEGFDPFGDEQDGFPAGRVPGTSGRATVGRASVGGPGEPGGPGGPGGPRGPRRGGPDGPDGEGGGRGRGNRKPLSQAEKRKRRQKRLIASLAVVVIVFGLMFLGGAWYYNSITIPNPPQTSATQIYYSDGSLMAQLGNASQQQIAFSQMPPLLQHAVVATEDETFYTNSGIDLKGIARAAVNDVTGGQTQGASTITQQYARHLEDLTTDRSYTRKIKEAFIALKMTHDWTKPQILQAYLNNVYFGRGATGIQAAAQTFFHKNASDLNTIANLPMAIVLADMIKDPAGNGNGPGPYDPSCRTASGQVCPDALNRFNYTVGQMEKLGWLDKATAATLKYPSDLAVKFEDTVTGANQNIDKPEGFIVRQVMSELYTAIDPATGKPYASATGKTYFGNRDDFMSGGYKIYTTINKQAQEQADQIFNIYKQGTPFYNKYKPGLAAEGVAFNPNDGGVIAYFGGPDGSGLDAAGVYYDVLNPSGSTIGLTGNHRDPGSSMKTITLATALSQGYGLDSMWNGPHTLQRPNGQAPLHNSGGDDCPYCTLWQGLKKSTNTLFFNVGQQVGIPSIVTMAANLGITHLWNDVSGKRYDLSPGNPGPAANKGAMPNEMAFGQAGVTLIDLAHVQATIANGGKRTTEHFVTKVTQEQISGTQAATATIYSPQLKSTQVPNYTSQEADDEMWAMQQVMTNGDEVNATTLSKGVDGHANGFSNQLANNRPAAAKTGTWEMSGTSSNDASNHNSVAAFNGYTAPGPGQVAASVWVGSSGKTVPLQLKSGANLGGASGAAPLWKMFVDAALQTSNNGKAAPIEQFPPRVGTGDKPGTGTPPPSAAPPTGLGGFGGFGVQQPSGVQAVATSSTSIQISWNPIPNGETYTVTRSDGQQINNVGPTGVTDNGLQPGTTYRYQIVASGPGGQSSPANVQATTLSNGGGGGGGGGSNPPPQPGNLNVAILPGQFTISWSASQGATSYKVTITDNTNGGGSKTKTTSGTSVTVNTQPGDQYVVTVVAIDASNNQSNPATSPTETAQ